MTFEWLGENSPNSLSCLKLQASFSLNFSSLFSIMRNSSVLFKLKLYMILTKGAHQSVNFQTFHCSCKISLNLYFHRLLLYKVYKISAKKVQRSYVSWPWRLMQNLKKNWCCFKNDKNLVNFDPSTQKSQNLHFQWFLLCKVFNIWPKKVQRSYLSWHWRVM